LEDLDPQEHWSDLEKRAIIRRKGNSEELSRRPSDEISFHCSQKPSEAYAVWQRQNLLEIGHFSYGPHHYYVWIDLRRYLLERSTEANEFVDEAIEQLIKWNPSWIFYEPHETTETLIDRLCEEALVRKLDALSRKHTWPVSDIGAFVNLYGGETSKMGGVAVFIDDGMVTGSATRSALDTLHNIGFRKVHSLAILDRSSPRQALLSDACDTGEHFAWWSLFVPPTGSARSCRICAGLETVRSIAGVTGSEALRAILQSWAESWTERDNLDRFEAAMEGQSLGASFNKRLGTKIELSKSEAVCAWVLDLSARLKAPAFLLEGDIEKHDVGAALTECLAGVFLHSWDELADVDKGELIDRLLDQLWSESRTSARGLIAIVLLSLDGHEALAVFKRLTDRILNVGLPNVEISVLAYCIAHKVSSKPGDVERRLLSWVRGIGGGRSQDEKQTIMRTNSLKGVDG
jgi:hypothetical protein